MITTYASVFDQEWRYLRLLIYLGGWLIRIPQQSKALEYLERQKCLMCAAPRPPPNRHQTC